jgi:uncharacterized protein YjbI with pentapeptide repeats
MKDMNFNLNFSRKNMINKFQTIIENSVREKNSPLAIVHDEFSNEVIFDQSIQLGILGDLKFFNVDFENVDLGGSGFSDFDFIETTFTKSILDPIGIRSVKISRSEESIQIEDSWNVKELKEILQKMDLIISTDQDEIQDFETK